MLKKCSFYSQQKFTPLNDKNFLTILYFPLTGGEFLANVLSCCKDFKGDKFFDELISLYTKTDGEWLETFENKHDDNIKPAHARYHTFQEWLEYKNIIYIDYTLSAKETNWLENRKKFINNSVSNQDFADLQIKYEKELINFFIEKKKKFFNFPASNFLNQRLFLSTMKDCISYFGYSELDDEKIIALWKQWMRLNLKKLVVYNRNLNIK